MGKLKIYTNFGGETQRKTPLVRSKRRWVYNIKIHLPEIEWESVDWIFLAQDWDKSRAVGKTVKNRSGSTQCWLFFMTTRCAAVK
jgi:hypothetical protein